VRKGIAMFQKVSVPILGIVENMSYYTTPTGERVEILATGGAEPKRCARMSHFWVKCLYLRRLESRGIAASRWWSPRRRNRPVRHLLGLLRPYVRNCYNFLTAPGLWYNAANAKMAMAWASFLKSCASIVAQKRL